MFGTFCKGKGSMRKWCCKWSFFVIDIVASGLPVRNGDAHAGEIASMALQLLSSFNGVGYKHLPNSQVQLRIGMHSGIFILFKEGKDKTLSVETLSGCRAGYASLCIQVSLSFFKLSIY